MGSTARTILFKGLKPWVVFVLGGPGSGKGTQCKKICEEFGFEHLSAGDLLRKERYTEGSRYGAMIERHITEGRIVPVEVTCGLLEQAMAQHCNVLSASSRDQAFRGKFLIDGFPRNEDNLTGWTRQLADRVEVLFVLFLDCPDDICVQRCLARGQQGSNRTDDNEVSLRKRLTTYRTDTMPIIEYYRGLNLLRQVDAIKSPDEVYSEVRKSFETLKN